MKKLKTKPFSLREETFALAFCICSCACSCDGTCNCPIAPTHQEGLNAQSTLEPLYKSTYNTAQQNANRTDFFL